MNWSEARKQKRLAEEALKAENEKLKYEHGQVRPLDSIFPAPENDAVYSAISWSDPLMHELARSIKEHGVKEPILISKDGYIISGHRRQIAAMIAAPQRCRSRFRRSPERKTRRNSSNSSSR